MGTVQRKSVFHDVLKRILGDYAQVVPVDTLVQTKMVGSVPTDVARMKGRRYLAASEAKRGTKLASRASSRLTGGRRWRPRFMRQDFFEFRPVRQDHLTSNHLQHVSDDPAIWRRLHLVSWEVVIPPRNVSRTGGAPLPAGGRGILTGSWRPVRVAQAAA